MFAPLRIATSRASRLPVRSTHARRPATASAPAGSMIERVSSKTSLMAAQIWSFETRTISSTVFCTMGKVISPTSRTATPSAKIPTRSSTIRRPASSDWYIASASYGSTPMTRMFGRSALT